MPAGDGITFSYGDYSLDPRPLFTVNKTVIKTPSNTGLSSKYVLVLNGHILPTDIDLSDNKGGLTTVWDDTYALRDAFKKDFELLLLQCDDTDSIISGYPKVVSIDINNASDNYVRRADYTINLEMASLSGTSGDCVGLENGIGDLSAARLVSLSDETSIEFLDERVANASPDPVWGETFPTVFRITRNVSAQGDSLPASPDVAGEENYIHPWQRARDYVSGVLTDESEFTDYFSGTMCMDGQDIRNSFRTISVNKADGSCNGSQTFVVLPTSNSGTIEDFEATVEQSLSDSPYTTVTINGTIRGFDDISNSGCPTSAKDGEDKFKVAKTKWDHTHNGLYSRAVNAVTNSHLAHKSIRPHPYLLHLVPLGASVGYNPIAGTVSYSYAYNDRLDFVDTNAISETITINYNHRPDLYASITILGRGDKGPLLQNLNTTGPETESVSVDVLYKPEAITAGSRARPTSWGNQYNTLFTTPPGGFLTSSTETWNPQNGHYTKSMSWEIGEC
jgi:hypothetical protein